MQNQPETYPMKSDSLPKSDSLKQHFFRQDLFKPYPLKLKPVYKDYIWGGRKLEKFRCDLPKALWLKAGNCHAILTE